MLCEQPQVEKKAELKEPATFHRRDTEVNEASALEQLLGQKVLLIGSKWYIHPVKMHGQPCQAREDGDFNQLRL